MFGLAAEATLSSTASWDLYETIQALFQVISKKHLVSVLGPAILIFIQLLSKPKGLSIKYVALFF